VKELAAAGFEMKNLSVVGKGYHTEERVVGFYNVGDRVKFWGKRGAFWGGPWGLFFGGLAEQRHAEQGPGFPELNKFGNGVFSVGGNVCDVDDAPLKRIPSGNGPTVHRRRTDAVVRTQYRRAQPAEMLRAMPFSMAFRHT
jgi:hypothetical protein